MKTDVTRRELAVWLAPAALSGPGLSQERKEAQADPLETARKRVREIAAKLDEFDLPATTEPAFVFRP